MKLSYVLPVAFIAAGGLIAAAAQGCSSSTTTTPGSTATVGGPPAKPAGPATTVTAEHNYAVRKLWLGDTNRQGVKSADGWKSFGYNVDGKVTTAASTDVCKLAPGATANVVPVDGDNGIDNSFGNNVVRDIIGSLLPNATQEANSRIEAGDFTVMIVTKGIDDANPTQTATGLSAYILAAGAFSPAKTPPTWTTADNWPVGAELLSNPSDPKSSKIQLNDAYMANGTFVSGTPSKISINISFQGHALSLDIEKAVITMKPGKGGASNGIISGVLETEALIAQLKSVAGSLQKSLCQSSTFEQIANLIRQTSDILKDGSNKAGVACDAISIGLGFEASEIGIPTKVNPAAGPSPDPCTTPDDAGTPPVDSGTPATDAGAPVDAASGG